MATVTPELIRTVRIYTTASFPDCKRALVACDGDVERAIEYLRERGLTTYEPPQRSPDMGIVASITIRADMDGPSDEPTHTTWWGRLFRRKR